MSPRRQTTTLALLSLSLSGCSLLSPLPLWELTKATGDLASQAMLTEPGRASDTVYHPHQRISELCIEYNPQTQTGDVLPALQLALRTHQIESRVYDVPPNAGLCQVWLRYSTQTAWDKPPLSDRYQAYVSAAALTLQSDRGQVLSSSHYSLESGWHSSKWASTQDKLAAVVSALVTGVAPVKQPANSPKERS
jgi:hypothetical protein